MRAVLFDYGMTLVRFQRPVAALRLAELAIAARIAAAGHQPPALEVLRHDVHDRIEREVIAHEDSGALQEVDIDGLERNAFADIGLHLDAEVREDCGRLLQKAWLDGVILYADATPVLRRLRDAGLRLGVCSNAPYRPASMHAQLRHLGITTLVDGAVFSGEVGWRKPHARMFSAALAAIGAHAASTLFVGDRPHEDVGGAQAMGMRAARIVRRGSRPSAVDPTAAAADATITTLATLPNLLESWSAR